MGTTLDRIERASQLRKSALQLSTAGLSILPVVSPLEPGERVPGTPAAGFRPDVRPAAEQIDKWWPDPERDLGRGGRGESGSPNQLAHASATPLYNIGLACGPINNIVAIAVTSATDRDFAMRSPLGIPDRTIELNGSEIWLYGWDSGVPILTPEYGPLKVFGFGGWVLAPGSHDANGKLWTLMIDKPGPWNSLTPMTREVSRLISQPLPRAQEPDPEPPRVTANDLRSELGAKIRISNCEYIPVDGGRGGSKDVPVAKSASEIRGEVLRGLNNWPRTAAGALFTLRDGIDLAPEQKVWWLESEQDLFAYFHSVADGIVWPSGEGVASYLDNEHRVLVTKAEFFKLLKSYPGENYDGISHLPHFPEIPNLFYLSPDLPRVDPSLPLWKKWISFFNPETEADRVLIEAACLTPLWGGSAGTRPAFVFTSRHGRGVGKTSTAEAISAIFGGAVAISPGPANQEPNKILVSPTALPLRCVIWDNLKGRTDSVTIESLITARTIQGHRLYGGHVSRPNFLTWFITTNKPEASTDLAQRCIPIEIGKARHGVDFHTQTQDFLAEHRLGLIAEMIHILSQPPQWELAAHLADRWQGWDRGVLCRLPGGLEALAVAASRRQEIDGDLDEADAIVEAILELIYRSNNVDNAIKSGEFRFSTSEITAVSRHLGVTRLTTIEYGRYLNRRIMDGGLSHLSQIRVKAKSGRQARGYLFAPGPAKMKSLLIQRSPK